MFREDEGDPTAKQPVARRQRAFIEAGRKSEQCQLLMWQCQKEGLSKRSGEGSLRRAGLALKIVAPWRWRFTIALVHIDGGFDGSAGHLLLSFLTRWLRS